jgi:hypothetical protein
MSSGRRSSRSSMSEKPITIVSMSAGRTASVLA